MCKSPNPLFFCFPWSKPVQPGQNSRKTSPEDELFPIVTSDLATEVILRAHRRGVGCWVQGRKTLREYTSGQIITTSAEVTLNGDLAREYPQNPLNSD